MQTRGRKLTQYRHRGFDFAGAAGHDVLVTDNLMRRVKGAAARHFGKMTPFSFNKWGESSRRSSDELRKTRSKPRMSAGSLSGEVQPDGSTSDGHRSFKSEAAEASKNSVGEGNPAKLKDRTLSSKAILSRDPNLP